MGGGGRHPVVVLLDSLCLRYLGRQDAVPVYGQSSGVACTGGSPAADVPAGGEDPFTIPVPVGGARLHLHGDARQRECIPATALLVSARAVVLGGAYNTPRVPYSRRTCVD